MKWMGFVTIKYISSPEEAIDSLLLYYCNERQSRASVATLFIGGPYSFNTLNCLTRK